MVPGKYDYQGSHLYGKPVILLTSLHYLYLASQLPFLVTVLAGNSYYYQDLGNSSI